VSSLDRILDRDDVLPAGAVHVVDDRRERRRLSGARGARDENESAVLLGQAPDAGGQREIPEVRDLARNHAESDRNGAALPEAVDAEPRQSLRRKCAVQLAGLEERLQPLRRLGANMLECELEVALGQLGLALELAETAVTADDRRTLHLEVDVTGAKLDGAAEHEFEIHRQPFQSACYGSSFSPDPPDEGTLFIRSGVATRRPVLRSATTGGWVAPRRVRTTCS
jgi:hypothetical protein